MEGLLSTGPTPSSFSHITFFRHIELLIGAASYAGLVLASAEGFGWPVVTTWPARTVMHRVLGWLARELCGGELVRGGLDN